MGVSNAAVYDNCEVVIGDYVCTRPMTNKKLRMCNAHSLQISRGVELSIPRQRRGDVPFGSQACSFDGCDRPVRARGFCVNHYWQSRHSEKVVPVYTGRRPDGSRVARDSEGRKQCATCREWLPEAAFGRANRAPDLLRYQCKDCEKVIRGRDKDKARINKIERVFNLPYADFLDMLDMLEAQEHRCYVCGVHEDDTFNGLVIDHDHSCCPESSQSCGECIRGLLCGRCNLTLGMTGDSIDVLTSLIAYVSKFERGAA